jgi:hypothetical protein
MQFINVVANVVTLGLLSAGGYHHTVVALLSRMVD